MNESLNTGTKGEQRMNKQVPDFKKLAQDIARKFDPFYDARLKQDGK